MTTLALAFGVLAAQVSAMPIGFAVTGGAGAACAAMPAAASQQGTVITLLSDSSPPRVVNASIGQPTSTCALDKNLMGGPYYSLRLRGAVPEQRTVWVAMKGEVPTRTAASGRLTARLGAEYPAVQIHSCTSSEGVHYSVWTGTPMDSRRLWHAYFYLGYDVQPSCAQRSEVED